MMRTYELMVVAKSDFPLDDDTKRQTLVKTLVGDSVSVENISLVGKKRLAYPINKQTEGVYLLATVTGVLRNSDIEKRATREPQVLRCLLVAKN